ncbi:unnamed protein product [Victoria cruziana]
MKMYISGLFCLNRTHWHARGKLFENVRVITRKSFPRRNVETTKANLWFKEKLPQILAGMRFLAPAFSRKKVNIQGSSSCNVGRR